MLCRDYRRCRSTVMLCWQNHSANQYFGPLSRCTDQTDQAFSMLLSLCLAIVRSFTPIMSRHNDFSIFSCFLLLFAGLHHAVPCLFRGWSAFIVVFWDWEPKVCFPCEHASHCPRSPSPHDALRVSSPSSSSMYNIVQLCLGKLRNACIHCLWHCWYCCLTP